MKIRLAILLLALTAANASACPSCRDSVATPIEQQQASALPDGFNRSIYLILGGFVAVLWSTSMLIAREVRRAPRNEDDAT
jgi:hypothetical protein